MAHISPKGGAFHKEIGEMRRSSVGRTKEVRRRKNKELWAAARAHVYEAAVYERRV